MAEPIDEFWTINVHPAGQQAIRRNVVEVDDRGLAWWYICFPDGHRETFGSSMPPEHWAREREWCIGRKEIYPTYSEAVDALVGYIGAREERVDEEISRLRWLLGQLRESILTEREFYRGQADDDSREDDRGAGGDEGGLRGGHADPTRIGPDELPPGAGR